MSKSPCSTSYGDCLLLFVGLSLLHLILACTAKRLPSIGHCITQVPANLLASPHFATNPVEAFRSAMTLCNNQLHLSSIDDSLSGTTAITCLIRGRMLHVANVGDSR